MKIVTKIQIAKLTYIDINILAKRLAPADGRGGDMKTFEEVYCLSYEATTR